jgi:ribulose-5-phosphate 4-epimerase/fuculose-1-phosphate aldolase
MAPKLGIGLNMSVKSPDEMLKVDSDPIQQARIDLAAAHRLAVHYGFHEGIDNHFTLLVPGFNDRFFLAPFGLHWSEIQASDFMIVDIDGTVYEGEGLVEETAFFIHAPMHQSNPELLRAVLHTHMPYATALAMLEEPDLVMASQNALSFRDLVFYDCEYKGLALDRAEGQRMTRALGDKSVLLLRNHGIVTTGLSIAEAFHNLYFFERTAEVQVLAQSTGEPLRHVPKDIVDMTVEQFKDSTHLDGYSRIDLHFAALKRMLDRSQPDYKL